MELCSDNHDEICFGGRKCPLCDMREEKDDEIRKLMEDLEEAKTASADMEREVTDLREQLAALQP